MKTSIHFYIRTDRPAKDGKVPVCLLFQLGKNQRFRINTGKCISLKKTISKIDIRPAKIT